MDQNRQSARKAKQHEMPARDGRERAAAAAARAEVVDILAGAIFTLLLEGRMPPVREDGEEQIRECS